MVSATESRRAHELLRRWGWILALLVILAAVYLPVFAGAIVFFRDPAHWNAPARFFLAESWRQGESVTWNPYEGLGFPVTANPLYGVFYPPNWLFALAGHASDPRAAVAHLLTWSSLLHLAFGSLGTGLLARRLGCAPTAALVAALAYGLGGYTTACWSAGLLLLAGAWVPWCGLAFHGLLARLDGGPRAWAGGVAAAALPIGLALTMGEVFVALMAAAFGAVTALAARERTAGRTEGPSSTSGTSGRRLRIAGLLAGALVLGASLGAVTVLPARAAVGSTQRGRPLPRVLAESCSVHPLRLVEMLVPGALGDALEDYPAADVVGEPMVDGLPLAFSVYVGASVLALVLAAFGRSQRLALRLALLAAFVLVVALGKHTPVHQLLRTIVRPLAYMRYPEKYLVLFVPWVSLLAGLGTTRILEAPARAKRAAWVLLALGVIGLAVAAGLFGAALRPHVLRGLGAATLALLGLAAAVWLLPRRPKLGRAALVAVVTLDLAAAAWPLQVFQPVSVAADVPVAASAVLKDAGPAALVPGPRPRVYRADAVEGSIRTAVPVANIGLGEFRSVATLVPNTGTMFGLATMPGYDAAIPNSLRLLWARGEHAGPALLRLLAVPYAVVGTLRIGRAANPFAGTTSLLDPFPGAELVRVPDVLPRVYLAGRAETLSDRETLLHIFDPDVLAGERALVADDSATNAPTVLPTEAGRAGACTLTAFHHDRVEARCEARRDAWAVFVEQHDAGWTAAVDGRAAPLFRTNWLLRGVQVPAGTHDVALSYRAPGLRAGALLSAAAVLVTALLAFFGRGRTEAPSSGDSQTSRRRQLPQAEPRQT